MAKAGTKKISEASQRVIDAAEAQFDKSTVELGGKIMNQFTRGDVSNALKGDVETIKLMISEATSRKWTFGDSPHTISRALEWIRLVRSVAAH